MSGRNQQHTPTSMRELLEGRIDAPSKLNEAFDTSRFENVARRLLKQFGEGDNGTLRRELFERLQRECIRNGEVVYRIISGAVRSSATARDPGRYFSATVSRRMREAGFFQDDFGGGW